MAAWNINVSVEESMVAEWWIVDNTPTNRIKVSFILIFVQK
jgi:hypothetical protein